MQKVVELHSLSANAVDGPEWVKCQALVYAWCGERNRALEQLARLENLPASPSLGHLKFSPKWMICAATRASKRSWLPSLPRSRSSRNANDWDVSERNPETFLGGSGENRWRRNSPEPKTMKTNLLCKIFSIIHAVIFSRPSLSRLRLATAGTLFLAAAGLAATAAMHPPKLPCAAPTVEISDQPYSVVQGVAVDQATNTIYVTSFVAGDQIEDSTIAVIDGRRCSATNASRCTALARMTHVGPAPIWLTFDPATRALYVTNGVTPDYDENNTITVLNTRRVTRRTHQAADRCRGNNHCSRASFEQ
jgi:hypothetical protein